jgi:hypothetical protein
MRFFFSFLVCTKFLYDDTSEKIDKSFIGISCKIYVTLFWYEQKLIQLMSFNVGL